MNTAGMQSPQKSARSSPMSNVQSHQEKLQFGQIYHLHQCCASICFKPLEVVHYLLVVVMVLTVVNGKMVIMNIHLVGL